MRLEFKETQIIESLLFKVTIACIFNTCHNNKRILTALFIGIYITT